MGYAAGMSRRSGLVLPMALVACAATSPSPHPGQENATAAAAVIVSPDLEVAETALGPTLDYEREPAVVASGDGGLVVWRTLDAQGLGNRLEAVLLDADG